MAAGITTLVAALLVLAGGFVVLRWMPGRPQPVTAPAAAPAPAQASAALAQASEDRAYEAELAILEKDMLESSEREG